MQKQASAPSSVCYNHSEADSLSAVSFYSIQKVFLSHPAMVLVTDADKKCLWWNQAADCILGAIPPSRDVYLHDVMFGAGDVRRQADEEKEGREVLFMGTEGGLVLTEAITSDVMITEYGACTLIIATNKSRERTRNTRREITCMQTEEFETIVSLSPVTAFRFSVQKELYPTYISDSIKQFGYTPRDFYTGRRCFWSVLHHEDISFVKIALKESLKKMVNNLTLNFRILTAMGQIRNIEGFFHLRDYHTSSLREFQCVMIDITGMDSGSETVCFAENSLPGKFPITLLE